MDKELDLGIFTVDIADDFTGEDYEVTVWVGKVFKELTRDEVIAVIGFLAGYIGETS